MMPSLSTEAYTVSIIRVGQVLEQNSDLQRFQLVLSFYLGCLLSVAV